jgi:hypothetical protein
MALACGGGDSGGIVGTGAPQNLLKPFSSNVLEGYGDDAKVDFREDLITAANMILKGYVDSWDPTTADERLLEEVWASDITAKDLVDADQGVVSINTETDSNQAEITNDHNSNLIEQGVDEPDWIKSDGKFLYMASEQTLQV